MKDFGLRLKQLRLHYNYTQGQVAEKLGCTVGAISAYESEQRSPSLTTLVELARIYQVSTDYLLGMTELQIPAEKLEILDVSGLSDKEVSALRTIVRRMRS